MPELATRTEFEAPTGGRPSPSRGERRTVGVNRSLLLLGAITLAGAAIRFGSISQQSFWWDEVLTHSYLTHGLGHLFAVLPRTESNPPLYYVLLWFWSRAFGLSEAGLRSFSALCGTLTIPMMYVVGRRLFGERIGLSAAVLTAVNPFLFWYSQEARSYALVVLLIVCSMYLLIDALERPSVRRLLAWGLVCALALCTHYFAGFVIAAEFAWLAIALYRRGRLTLARAALAGGPVIVCAAALLPLLIRENHDGRASWIANQGSIPWRLALAIGQNLLGGYQPARIPIELGGAILAALAVGLLIGRSDLYVKRAVLLPLSVGAGAAMLALGAAALGQDYIDSRNLLPLWAPLALVAAAGFGARYARRVGALALLGISGISIACIVAVLVNPVFQRPDWRDALHVLGPARTVRAIVAGDLSYYPATLYLPKITIPSTQATISPEITLRVKGAIVGSVDLVFVQNGLMGRGSEPLPGPRVAPPPPGFRFQRQIRTDHYVVVTYAAPRPVWVRFRALLALVPSRTSSGVMLQRP